MDPVEAIERLESQPLVRRDSNVSTLDSACGGLYCKRPLEVAVRHLFRPPIEESTAEKGDRCAKRAHKEPRSSGRSTFRLDWEAVTRICPSATFDLQTDEENLGHIEDSLELLRSCLAEMPGFNQRDVETPNSEDADAESQFNQLFESFLTYANSSAVPEVRLEGETEGESKGSTTEVGTVHGDDREVLECLLRCLLLWCNWVFQMNAYARRALQIVQSPVDRSVAPEVLALALGVREANRNMAVYSTLCVQLSVSLRSLDEAINHTVTDLLCKVQYIRQILATSKAVDATAWPRLAAQLSAASSDVNEIPLDSAAHESRHNINRVRNEMRARMNGKGRYNALARECDLFTQELAALNSRKQGLATRYEKSVKLLQELVNAYRTDTYVESVKVPDAKKLSPLLYHFLARSQLSLMATPNRDVSYKVVREREREYALQMSLAAPRDMLMPSSDAAAGTFPLVFCVSVDSRGALRVREPRYPFAASAASPFTQSKVHGQSRSDSGKRRVAGSSANDSTPTGTPTSSAGSSDCASSGMGLEAFTLNDHVLPAAFHHRLRWWYEAAHQHIWNCALADSYRNGKMEVQLMLPHDLRRTHVSRYTWRTADWALANDGASIKMRLEFDEEQQPRCSFSDFEPREPLRIERVAASIEEVVKDVGTLAREDVCEVGAMYDIDKLF
ncbi:HR1 rho-binding repeat containing protein [Babesia caballi]|uniref:HR1 rho-binding repeat containing protein n=1 Tax=Babesia caballi TaxID=5871 RepID=A0AAV4M021_BABCB|nr:HR1 rho-binding repeat containing protein [Babesia caballi]